MIRLLAALALLVTPAAAFSADAARAEQAIAAAGFQGVAIFGEGDAIVFSKSQGEARPGTPFTPDQPWRLASVTKQLTTLIAMQEVQDGRMELDRPVSAYWPSWSSPNRDTITIRMLMRHTSGLFDPAATPENAAGVPEFYMRQGAAAAPARSADGTCAANPRETPPAEFHYNNCDFIVLGTILEKVTGKPFATLLRERIAAPLGLASLGLFPHDAPAPPTVPGMSEGGKAEPAFNFGSYGAAGGAYMAPVDLWTFDRALMENRLLDRIQTAEMWAGVPDLGYAALGQWSFSAPIKGCPDPVALIERRGAIGGVQIRNFLIPARRVAVILFTNRADFDFGEVWQGQGFSHDLLAAALCPAA